MNGGRKYMGLIYLVGLLIVVPLLAYNIAISDTVRMSRAAKRTQREIGLLKNDSPRPEFKTETSIGKEAELQKGGLIPIIMGSDAGARCAVVKYTPYITENRDGLTVHTAELVLSGGYTDLVRLVERIEVELASCRLVSANFKSIKQRQRKPQLHVTLILQQITQTI